MKPLTLGNVTLQLPLRSNHDRYEGSVVDGDGLRVCHIDYACSTTMEDNDGIAKLFAASPDLLLAAERVVKESEPPTDESDWEPSRIRFGSALDNLRTAIARARGKES